MEDRQVSLKQVLNTLHRYFDGMLETDTWSPCDVYGLIEILPSALEAEETWYATHEYPPEQRWIPVKTRPMTEVERQEYSEYFGCDIEYEDAVMFECKMPDDGQDVWVCSKCGNVWQDTCVVEEGIGL